MSKTFTAIDTDGTVIYSGRGKIGAAQKALNALLAYREAVEAASGYLYGNPMSLGRLEIDGVLCDTDHFYDASLVA